MKIQEKIKKMEILQKELNTLKQEIYNHKDGYIYEVCIHSYGTKSWNTYFNIFTVQETIDEYGDGYDGLIDLYTDNPNPNLHDEGCLTIYTIDELPESRRKKMFLNQELFSK